MLTAALLTIGCRSSDDGTLEGDVPDVESTTTTTEPSTTSTTRAPACAPVERGTGDEVREFSGDVDGDGRDDRSQSFPAAGRVTLLVDLAAGGGAVTEIPTGREAPVELIGTAHLGAEDGPAVLWVRVGAGASTTILGLYHLDGCELDAATFESGEPVELPIGGTVGTATGARCGSGVDPQADLLVYEATLVTGREYEVVTTEYRWGDGTLVPSPSEPTVTRTEDLSEASSFRCGDVSL